MVIPEEIPLGSGIGGVEARATVKSRESRIQPF